jgi:hypothetical protein
MTLDGFITAALIYLFLAWFYGPWQDVCTDYARQIVFEQRDKLFDLAADGKIKFESKEYRTLRASLNSVIRFAHDATIPRLIYVSFIMRGEDYKDTTLYAAIENVKDMPAHKDIEVILAKSMITTAWFTIIKSLPCAMILIIALPLVVLLGVCMAFVKTVKDWIVSVLKVIGCLIQFEAEFDTEFTH